MIIERELVEESTLEAFADKHGLVMRVYERPSDLKSYTGYRYHAAFKGCEIVDGGWLTSASGNGNTEAEAIADFAAHISEKRLIIDAMKDSRREIQAPRFVAEGP